MMKPCYRRAGLLLALFLFVLPATAQTTAEKVDALVQKYADAGLLNGAVLVAENDEVIYKNGFGYANMEWDIVNTPETKFRIGSVTKQFTAALILQLAEEGKLDVHDPVSKYLPDYAKPQGDQVTIHHLLTHTSGIVSMTNMREFMQDRVRDAFDSAEMMEVFGPEPLEFEPGTQFNYSNSGYYLLGVIIEQITGQPYDEVLRERLLDPLGLADTGYDHYGEIQDRSATGYRRVPGGFEHAFYLDTSIPYAAGMMYSTVEDLFRWDRALRAGKVFQKPETQALMYEPFLNNYAYGWVVRDVPMGDRTVKTIGHDGGIFGFATTFVRFPDDGHMVVVMDNTENNKTGEIAQKLAALLYGQPAADPLIPISDALAEVIEQDGLEAALTRYHHLKKTAPGQYDFSERELNRLGYRYLGQKDYETAIAIFQLNVEMFPEAFNPYDSLGEAYMEAGDRDKAIANYQKSIELNPGNQNGRDMLEKLGVASEMEEVTLSEDVLERYVGVYEVRPGFQLTITREGANLHAQATGQPKVGIFPESETRFYLKVVPAQIEFHLGDDGHAASLTLFQNGQEIPATRVE